jgi:putative glutamine amidotransferase
MDDAESPAALEALRVNYELARGVVFAGGNDVDPELYGGKTGLPTTEEVSAARDGTEIQLIKWAEEDKKPVLFICRGLQLWNVVRGGSLYQHLPDDPGTKVNHINHGEKQLDAKHHEITIERASRMGSLLLPTAAGQDVIEVNSYHHQGIDRLGKGLRAIAWAPDGLVEAVETTDSTHFAVGLQPHPELIYEQLRGLFEGLIGACAARNEAFTRVAA